MRKLIYVSLMILLVLTLFAGCDNPPKPPPVVSSEIVCEGGHYAVYNGEWTMTGCEGDEQVKGTYWFNLNGRIFYLGEPVPFDASNKAEAIKKVYGDCPTSFVSEVGMKKEYLEEVSKNLI